MPKNRKQSRAQSPQASSLLGNVLLICPLPFEHYSNTMFSFHFIIKKNLFLTADTKVQK